MKLQTTEMRVLRMMCWKPPKTPRVEKHQERNQTILGMTGVKKRLKSYVKMVWARGKNG